MNSSTQNQSSRVFTTVAVSSSVLSATSSRPETMRSTDSSAISQRTTPSPQSTNNRQEPAQPTPTSLAQTLGRAPRSSRPCTISIQKFSSSLLLLPKHAHSIAMPGPRRLGQYRPCTTPLPVLARILHGSSPTGTIHWILSSSSSRSRAASRSVSPAHCRLSASAFPQSLTPFFIKSTTAWLWQVSVLVLSRGHLISRCPEPQPTSSKWRALTHQHIHAMYPSLTEYSITELTDTILRWSSDIFLIAGCLTYEPTTSSSSSTATSLRSRFGEHIRRFSKSVIHLAKVLREEILSTSFELIAIDPNDCKSSSSATASNGLSGPSFHERTMIDAFSGYGHSHGCVLATMELGLRCVTRIGTREGVGSEEEVLLEQRVLLMPKVVLESVLDVLDQ